MGPGAPRRRGTIDLPTQTAVPITLATIPTRAAGIALPTGAGAPWGLLRASCLLWRRAWSSLRRAVMRVLFPVTSFPVYAASILLRAAVAEVRKAAGVAYLVNLHAWAGPLMRSMLQLTAVLIHSWWARRAEPARPPLCLRRPGCGRPEGGRRLAGPGLGDAVTVRSTEMAVGRPPLRRAAPLSTAEGGRGE
jgi:hypothetical protein